MTHPARRKDGGAARRCPAVAGGVPLFLLALLPALLLAGCGTTDPSPRGVVQGIVLVEGNALSGVTVELTGPLGRSATTDLTGRYRFDEIPAGAYVVSIRGAPPDAAFPATSRSAVVSEGGTVTVDFQGSFIRTASISGTVTSGGRGVGGVNVLLRGAASASTQTDAQGAFAFPGLRAGFYEVEITAIPSFLTFPSTRTTVELSTGQDHVVSFDGRSEVTASAVIRSLVQRLPSGETVPLDPSDVRGLVEVTVTLDRGEDTPDSLVVLVGERVVAKQTFGQGVGVGGEPGEAAGSPVDLVFPVNTAAFDPGTGIPLLRNGATILTVQLATREAGPAAWTASVPLTLRNLDTFAAQAEGSRGPVTDTAGLRWWGGELSVRLLPVVYSPGREITSAVVELHTPGGPTVAQAGVLGQGPFTARFPSTPGTPGSIAGYQTTADGGDALRVTTARYADGGLVPGLPIPLEGGLHLDLRPPEPTSFVLPRASDLEDCCLQNWVGSAFRFASALGGVEDRGVGGAGVTFHAGAAELEDAAVAELPPLSRGDELAASSGNAAYRAVAVLSDALDNRRVVPLEPGDGNPLGNARGAVFGVDLTPPQAALDPDGAGLGPTAVNPPAESRWVLSADGGDSGLGTTPVRASVRRVAPGVSGAEACLVPGPGPCAPVSGSLVWNVPASPPGYLVFRGRVLDRGGNRSGEVVARVLRDGQAPEVEAPSLPSTLVGGMTRSFASVARDNVDLHLGQLRLRFGDATGPALPFASPETLGTPFQDPVVPEAAFVVRFPFVEGLEAAPDGVPHGTPRPAVAVEAEAVDAAGQRAVAPTPIPDPSAFALRSFSVSTRGAEGVSRWEVQADGAQVCRGGSHCGEAVPGALEVTARVRGPAEGTGRPFEAVHILAVVGGVHRWMAVTSAGEVETVGSGPQGREWRWQVSWTPPAHLPAGTIRLVAVGVDAQGMALITEESGAIQVVAP